MLCAGVWNCWVIVLGLPLSSKLSVSLQIEGVLCLAESHVVAKIQGYYLVCIWGSLVKFQGVGVVVKFDLFSHCYAVFLCCLRAACKQLPTLQIMFQVSKQLSWWLLDLVLLSSVGLDCLGRPVAMKNGVNWGDGFAIGDVNTKNCPLKCLFLQTNEESFTFVTFKTDVSIKW